MPMTTLATTVLEGTAGRFIRLPRKEYAALLDKAKAHDQYLAATKKMRERQAEVLARKTAAYASQDGPIDIGTREYAVGWDRGWLACLGLFSAAVVSAGMDGAPFTD